jgi:DNA-binding winged helix-turn-helix (wHTH) protein/tetratricopeptide (TPR) repeat protein
MATPARPTPALRFGAFLLDAGKGELRKGNTPLKLHPQPFRVLLMLVEHAGEIVTRDEIKRALWGEHTWVDFDGGINFCIRQIRSALSDNAEQPRYVETIPRTGYRFLFPLTHAEPREQIIPISRTGSVREQHLKQLEGTLFPSAAPEIHVVPPLAPVVSETNRRKTIALAAFSILVILSVASVSFFYFTLHRKPKLAEKDTVVIADFRNTTGDPVFDEALKEGLAVELGQSPFLNVLSDKKVGDTLRMMGWPPDKRLTNDTARELCVRSGSKALVSGTITRLGNHYLVDLDAVLCSNGDTLAREQSEASRKEDTLKALSRASSGIRAKLGESLPSLQKYDTPIEATTASLEALQNLSMAGRVAAANGDAASIPFAERALNSDPNFALAYTFLAGRYTNLNQPSLALEYAAKAYQLRDRVTEREQLQISAIYFRATGNLESMNKTLELWKVNYPRDSGPHGSLCANYAFIGQYENALFECQEAVRLNSDNAGNYENLAGVYLSLNRYDEAQRTCEQALARGMLCAQLYNRDFVRGDSAGMAQEFSLAAGEPGYEDAMLSAESNTRAYHGKMRQARELSGRATESARRSGLPEAAALWRVIAALREAELGETSEARRGVTEALRLAPGRNAKILGAIALARIGETAQARGLVNELDQSYPNNTLLKIYWFPVVDAAIGLKKSNLSNTFNALEVAAPYDLAQPSPNEIGTLYPAYLRGQAYLIAQNGTAAAAEFQKVLDHPGVVLNFVTGALAHLGLGRAYVLQGDTAKARAAYDDFFMLWKDADPDISVLKQARAEYGKLQ